MRLFGLNTGGDVDGNDKLHLAVACAPPTTSPPTRSQTLCPPGQFVRAIAADRSKLRTYLLRVAMIEGVRRGNAIT